MAKCPGQDRYFWTPDDMYDAPCPACGKAVEFLKTDPSRKCPGCGYAFANPKLDPGCARWCPHAELCVGVKLATQAGAPPEEGTTVRLVDRLVAALRDEAGVGREYIVHALAVLQQAQRLLREEGGDPRVGLAVVALHGLDVCHAAPGPELAEDAARPDVAALLKAVGFDEETVQRVSGILCEPDQGPARPIEADVLWDAHRLARLAEASSLTAASDPEAETDQDFRTATGRRLARELAPSLAQTPA